MLAEGCLADQADDTAQGNENDDDVIGVTQNGHKIGDEINRKGEVGKQEAEPDTDPPRLRTVLGEPCDKSHKIGQKPERFLQNVLGRPSDPTA